MTSDERLRDAYTRAVDARTAPQRTGCVTPDALLALVRADGREADRLATLDHAMACAACRDEFELLRSVERAGGEDVRHAVAGIRWKRHLSMAIAASVVLAVGLNTGRRVMDTDDGPMRSGPDTDIVLVSPALSETLRAGHPVTFAWHAVPGARSYLVELLTPQGDVAIDAQTRDTTVKTALASSLRPGDYYWSVRALVEDGSERRSEARIARIRE